LNTLEVSAVFKNKKNILLVVLIFLLVVVSGFLLWRFIPLKKVTVGPKWVNQAQFAGLFTAKEKGYYRKNGLDVSFREFGTGTDLIADLVSGKTDFTITSAEEYLLARDNGSPVMAIAVFYQTSPYALVSSIDSGITNPTDFKGKVLGSKSGKIEEDLVYEILLNSVGLTKQDATIKIVGFDKREVDNIAEKKVDVIDLYRTDQLYFFDKEKIGYNIIYPEQYGIGLFNDVLVTRTDLINKDSKLIHGFVKASIEGWDEALKNKKKAITYTLKYVTAENYKDVDYETYILEQSAPLIKQNSNSRIGLMEYMVWNKMYSQMKSRGFIKNNFSVNDLFTNEFLP
jgi:ABC-type nitrate/sulfonate/bicarbonate transport system substrate-binding protein